MNVLFVNNFRSRGGGEEFLGELLPGLARRGINVGLICRPGTPLVEMFRNTAVAVYPISRSGLEALTSVFKISAIIRKNGYEIINIQRGHDIIQTWLASLLSGRKPVLIYTAHVADFIRSRFLLGRMRGIITISRYLQEKIAAYAPAMSKKVRIIYHGIDLAKFKRPRKGTNELKKRFGISADTAVIGTVGVLWKNQIEFLDALVEIRKALPDTRYALVASETGIPQIRQFKERAAELGLTDAVLWVGRLAKDDMPSFYADINLSVSTFRNEGFGIWVLESLAMGTPVVAFDAGGVSDSLHHCPSGVLVQGDIRQMASEIVRVLQNTELHAGMSEAAPRWVEDKFTRERMIEDYVGYFQALLGGGVEVTTSGAAPLRILQMISKNDRYGAQRIFLDQIAVLHAMGNEITVVGRGVEGYVTDSVRALGLPYHGLSLKSVKDIFTLRSLIRKKGIDIIHTTLDGADYFGVLLSFLTHRPVICTMMVPRYHIGYRLVDKVIVLSNKQKILLERRGVKASKVAVIRPGIDIGRFSVPDGAKRDAWKRAMRAERYSIVFSHISSIIPRKGHGVSLELVSYCKKQGEEPLLVIIGDPLLGNFYESLVQKISDMGLERNVFFTGWTSDIPEILSLCHFTALPSEKEALGIVLMEGMAAGVPIIAREGEGGAELIEEYGCGFLYRLNEDIGVLAETVLSLRRDPEKYGTLSERCKAIAAKEFHLSQFGAKLLSIYGELCNPR